MTNKSKFAALFLVAILFAASIVYVFTAPYSRIAGVRIGGTTAPPPADFAVAHKRGIGLIKTGGFPPFVVHVVLVPFKDGFITATRPDGGYWSKRARIAPEGYVRYGNTTYAMKATEVLADARLPYLREWGGPDLDRRLSGGVIVGESEPLRDWQVFLWTPR